MQSVLFVGRLFSRAVANGLYSSVSAGAPACATQASEGQQPEAGSSSTTDVNEINNSVSASKKLRFLTAVSGFPKNRTLESVKPGKFGDDAYFVVKHNLCDVIGEWRRPNFFSRFFFLLTQYRLRTYASLFLSKLYC